jgi:hypothetical protein
MTKKIIFSICICLITLSKVWAQSPNKINYQGVAMNAGGNAIANQNIKIRASVHNLTPTGTILYSEERSLTTESGGLFNFQIGASGATAISGTWSAINWDTDAKYLQIEMDATGGTNFVDMGTQQLVSVPYAQHSNTSGALIPTATINPNQITTTGAATNQVLTFNGTNWAPGTINGGGLTLPYSATNSASESFHITNTFINSTAIQGSSNGGNGLSRGIVGIATGNGSQGVYGKASGANGIGVFGYTNTQSAISIQGQHANGGIAIKGTTVTGSSIIPSILGECNGASGIGVKGISDGSTGTGVYGETSNGTAVKGYANNVGSIAVFGSSLAGTGVLATSFTGKALDVNGNLKISGGNTNPTNGAVLTSDASGNAIWKNNKIGFQAAGVYVTPITASTITKLKLPTELYDASNNFNTEGATTDKSTFIVPVSGLYHFDMSVTMRVISATSKISSAHIYLKVNEYHERLQTYDGEATNWPQHSYIFAKLNEDIHLNTGDKVSVWVTQHNPSNVAGDTMAEKFSGHLVFAD